MSTLRWVSDPTTGKIIISRDEYHMEMLKSLNFDMGWEYTSHIFGGYISLPFGQEFISEPEKQIDLAYTPDESVDAYMTKQIKQRVMDTFNSEGANFDRAEQ